MNWVPARRPLTDSKYSSKLTRSRPPSASPNPLDRGLKVYLQTRSITASKCISEFTPSRPPSASPNSLYHGLQVLLWVHSILASKSISKLDRSRPPSASPHSLDRGLQVYLQTRSITAWKFAKSWPPSAYPHPRSITASKCISKYARLPPPSASPKSLDHGLGVYLWVHLIVIFRHSSNCSQAPPTASPDIACVDGYLYRYIDT